MLHALAATLLFSHACFAEPREREPTYDRAKCDQGRVNGCVQQNQRELDFARHMSRETDRALLEANARLVELRKAIAPAEAELARISEELQVVNKELKFIGTARAPARDAIEGHLSLDDLFEIPRIRRSWDERYPAERAAKMRARINELRVQDSEQKAQLDRILPTYRAVSSEYQSALAQKNNWLAAETQHARMCESGCREDICPLQN